MLVVYTDYQSYEEEGHTVYVPGFKIGDGNAYVVESLNHNTDMLAVHSISALLEKLWQYHR